MAVTEITEYDDDKRILACRGNWDINHLADLKSLLAAIAWPTTGAVKIDGHGIAKLDTAGAWVLCLLQDKLERQGIKIRYLKFSEESEKLISIVQDKLKAETTFPTLTPPKWLARIGMQAVKQYKFMLLYLNFIGRLAHEGWRILKNPKHLRWNSIAASIFRTGYQALPIIALLSFMIGVVITFQMGLQLKNYGANVFIVDLLGLSVLREFGPLITAIMVAGRTGSAFTAQLGIMKINQEIDALDTMGVTPAELLLLPRIIGLFIALPLLTMWADVFGVIGGMVMSNNMLSITWYDFLRRFSNVIPLRALLIGLGKTPIFALIIASIGCFSGMQVKDDADSVGKNTTSSVVLSIFFIIVADAIFSVIFSKLKL